MELSIAQIRDSFDYDPMTGVLVWRKRNNPRFDGRFAGKIAGSKFRPKGSLTKYFRVKLFYKQQLCHRIAYAHFFGEIPNVIDHIDGDGLNNRIKNLRSVEFIENCRNTPRQANNTSGITGVHFNKREEKYFAYINVKRKRVHLGAFSTLESAIDARSCAEKKYGFHENHGRKVTGGLSA